MNRQLKYAQIAVLFVLGMTGSMFAQGSSAPQPAPATRFGLPAVKPATAPTSQTTATTISAPPTNQGTSKTGAPSIGSAPAVLKVSAANVVLTQKGVTSSVTIPCSKFVFNAANTASLVGSAGKATWSVTFTKPWDTAQDPFLTALMAGGSFDSVSFAFVGPSGQPVYTIALKTVMIKSIDKGFDAATGAASEDISLMFGAFKMVDAAGNPGVSTTSAKGAGAPTTFQDAWISAQ